MASELDRLLAPQKTEHWGSTCEFQPVLLDKIYGDGKLLMQLFPISERPRYWVVRVDSIWEHDVPEDDLDDIYEQIDEQFGPPPEDDDGIGDERPYFPSYDGDGTSWHFVREAVKRLADAVGE